MIKKIKYLLGSIFCLYLIFIANNVYAASAGISAGGTTLEVNEITNLNVSVTATEAWDLKISASGGTLSGTTAAADAAGEEVNQNVISAEFSASSAGTYTISLTGSITGSDLVKENVSKSITITVKETTSTPTPDPTPSKSSDTSLKSLTVSPFGNLNEPYDITVDNKYDSVTISAEANHPNATVSGKIGEFSLEEGTNQFKIVVTAEDGTQKTYSVYVRRKVAETTEPITPPNVIDENNEEEEKTDDNKTEELGLTNLVITGIDLNPKFSIDVYEYKAEFSEDIDTLEILATPNMENATLEIVGNSNLKIGENLITIIVKSEDGETTKTYQILVTKNEPEVVASTDDNTITTEANKEQEIKSKIGKIILIAAAAIIAVIIVGIIAIINTKKSSNINKNDNQKKDKETFNKNDFRVAVNEEESYKELEKLSNIHNTRKNTVDNNQGGNIKSELDNTTFEENSTDEQTKSEIENSENENDIGEVTNKLSKTKKSKGRRFK